MGKWESGKGRYDLAIFPTDPVKDTGAIFELKALSKKMVFASDQERTQKLDALAQRALEQIEKKNYMGKFKLLGVETVRKVGIAFCGKEMLVACEEEDEEE